VISVRSSLAFWLTALALSTSVAAPASADPTRLVDGPRLLLSDFVRSAPLSIAETDVGAAPPPGATRVVSREEIARALERSGVDAGKVAIPKLTRVESRAERLSPDALIARVTPSVEAALPPGVVLEKLSTSRSLVLSPRAEIGAVRVPKLPKREGAIKVTLSVEIMTPGGSPLLVPFTSNLRLGPEAAQYTVPRGAELTAYIERGPTRIGAIAVALGDADVNDEVLLQIVKTRKILKARVESKSTARVVSE
jgi:hypothetical protein